MCTEQLLNLTIVTSLEVTTHYTWQQLPKKKTEKLRETGILWADSEGYTDQSLYKIKKLSKFS